MQILLLRRHAAADVALCLVDVQNLAHLGRERGIDIVDPVADILMYGAFADAIDLVVLFSMI